MIWDASDANPMHRRIPAEVVSRRARAPPKRAPPQEKEREAEDSVIADLKSATVAKPEARPRWLMKACKLVAEGKAPPTELYNVIVSRKFAANLPERVSRRLVSHVEENLDLFSDKQRRYLSSSDCPLMALRRPDVVEAPEIVVDEGALRAREQSAADAALALMGGMGEPATVASSTAQREREERRQREEEGAAKWQAAQDEAALRRQVADAKAHARREAARREEKQRQQDAEEAAARRQAEEEQAARRRKLEAEADDIFALALVPQQPPGAQRARSRSQSGAARSGGSRSISSRTARRRARANNKKNRRPDWQQSMGPSGSALTGSRALLMNRDYVEDLPHLPRPSGAGPPPTAAKFGSRSRSRQRPRR